MSNRATRRQSMLADIRHNAVQQNTDFVKYMAMKRTDQATVETKVFSDRRNRRSLAKNVKRLSRQGR